MTSEELPTFLYHPDPVATGSIVHKAVTCLCCEKEREYTYVGPVFAEEELDEELCPWCVADGSAAAEYDATFTDATWGDAVSAEVTDVVCRRTPGFNGWQQERWLHHCDDAAEFHGRAGTPELAGHPDAQQAIRADMEKYDWTGEQVEQFLRRLSTDGDATAYLFRCRHCRAYLAYADFA